MHPGNYKLALAARYMTIDNGVYDRSRNKMYSWLREKVRFCGEEHPQFGKPSPLLGRKIQRVWAADSKAKMSARVTGAGNPRSESVVCVETGVVYPSRAAAAKWLNSLGFEKAHGKSLKLHLRGVLKTAYGFHWRYA
jgi:hypothetical protein